jgi:transposase
MGRQAKHHRRHSREFREQACKLVTEQGYSALRAAKELGIARNTLWNWLTESGKFGLRARQRQIALGDDPPALRARIKELEQRVRQLQIEKQILKKATAFFAREQPQP